MAQPVRTAGAGELTVTLIPRRPFAKAFVFVTQKNLSVLP